MLKKLQYKIISIILLGFFLSDNVYSQNLVVNPSFENYSNCPNNMNELIFCDSWNNPTLAGSPDYYNICSVSNLVDVPTQNFGTFHSFQQPKTGSAYIGITTFGTTFPNVREYIQSSLMLPFVANECYFVNFYINSVDWSGLANNNIGAFFSINEIYNNNGAPSFLLNYASQIKKIKNPIMFDTSNWVNVAGVYKAIGGEQFITIGNFDEDEQTNSLIFNSSALNLTESYYFIDDVSVIAVSDLPNSMLAFAGNDTIVAPGDSIFIGQEIANLNCTWRKLDGTFLADSTSGIWVQPSEETTYVVEQNLCGTITYDTVVVSVGYVGLNPLAEALEASSVKIFPNPNNGKFYLKSLNKNDIKIFDLQGRLVKFSMLEIDSNTKEIEIDAVNGMYNVQIIYSNSIENVKIKVSK